MTTELPRNLELMAEDGTMSRGWFDSLVKLLRGKAEVTETKIANIPTSAVKVKLYFDGQFLYMEQL